MIVDAWTRYGRCCNVDAIDGSTVIKCETSSFEEQCGIFQHVEINQSVSGRILMSAFSFPAELVDMEMGESYSIYTDVHLQNGQHIWGVSEPFETVKRGQDSNWSYAEKVIKVDAPIKSMEFYLLFRHRTGTVYFKKPSLRQQAE
jgi:hypothetical protein